jgi:choice-of-anchor A domain-containing protein
MNKFLTLTLTMTLFLSACFAPHASAIAIDLGDASKYNAFFKGDFTTTGNDTEGRVAVGGNVIINGGHDIGAEIKNLGLADGPSLVVGGNIIKTGNASFNVYGKASTEIHHDGVIDYAGKITNNGEEITSAVNGNVEANFNNVIKAELPVDFESAFKHLDNLSTNLMNATAHATGIKDNGEGGAEVNWGPLNFTPTKVSSDNVYVFNVTQEQVNTANEWKVKGVSDDATIIFNIANPNGVYGGNKWNQKPSDCQVGETGCVNFSQVDLSINGKQVSSHFPLDTDKKGKGLWDDAQHTFKNQVLYNFPDATKVNLAQSVYGSILAPNADLKVAGQGAVWGHVIGKSWEGSMQINHTPFGAVGTKPPRSTPVPTPATLWIFALALALLYVNRKPFIKIKRKPIAEKSEADTEPNAFANNSVVVSN